ncbi:MAG: dihydropteroate synthase [Micavibrio aeruginosavorus]|uniref:Dihydropteroate synthase n=1 Tax=Micavibrio aeruginosavorus TaxID=349221 RepID=A0A2W5PLB8_9BACT|nr:MAG: dihydropteroate synthase [Micavibrio aeruginosavorus]
MIGCTRKAGRRWSNWWRFCLTIKKPNLWRMAGMADLFLSGDDPLLMGIVNVTPDSFSDGGEYLDPAKAVAHGKRLVEEGAHILDIGGESTRPGSEEVNVEEELRRVVPVVLGLKDCGAMISVDTRNAVVMKAVVEAGAGLINDVSALTHDKNAMAVVAQSGAYVCLMHMKGDPKTMQDDPMYDDVFSEVRDYLKGRIEACLSAGIKMNRIIIDPGIGFGKALEHNLSLLNRLGEFGSLQAPVLLGASRKRFIGALCGGYGPDQRLAGSLAAVLAGYERGVRIFRVHDVAETAQALAVWRAVNR